MADHEAWARQMLLVPIKSFGAIYVLYRYILEDSATGSLRQASCIMLFLGIFKYVKSSVALRRGDLGVVRSSFKQLPSSLVDDDFGEVKNLELDDEKALLVAHILFDICKGTFSDYSMEYIDRVAIRSIFSGRWKTVCKVVEMGVSLMHDILYTKAYVVDPHMGWLCHTSGLTAPDHCSTTDVLARL
ncbi:hypothetical protein VPH35_017080 [Triticum aestivum]|uniref:DUF4220 domain-containing protein n=1 Tax=Aegilops tauschii TaxID=37682 RepID=R7W865_AEGTA